MTAKGQERRQRRRWLEPLLDELTDETEDERRDFADPERNLFESEHGPEMGSDGDDNPEYAQAKDRLHTRNVGREGITKPEQLIYPVQGKPADNLPGQMVEAGHGFIVNDPRSRPWKTAKRTHCAHCGGELPKPDVSAKKYRCEFEPPVYHDEVPAMADGGVRPPLEVWRRFTPAQRHRFATGDLADYECQCSGCTLRQLVVNGGERNVGNPRKCCSASCTRLRDNERSAWKRAVDRANRRGEEPPPEPEDKGLKFRVSRGPRSSIEGNARRYTAANGHRWELPRA